jgi:hypothetical protein
MYEAIQFKDSNLNEKDWENFVLNSSNGTIFHLRKFLSYHPKERFKDSSLVIIKNKKIVALFPAVEVLREDKKTLWSHCGASYGGWIYENDLNFQEAFGCVESVLEFAKENNFERIQLTPPPIIYQTKYSNYIDFALVKNGFDYVKRDVSSIVQLDFTEDELLSTFRAEARTAVKKAIKQGVIIRECDEYENYYKILKKNLKLRHNVNPTHTLDELIYLKNIFPDEIRLYGAFVDDVLIAGVCNFSVNKNVVLAFYISHDEEYQEYRAVNLLFYEIMKSYKQKGFRYLDFGIFTVNMEPNWGLGRFKENFGARGIFRDTYYKNL